MSGVRFDKENSPEQKQGSEVEDNRRDSRSANGIESENPSISHEIKQRPDKSPDDRAIPIIDTNNIYADKRESISAPSPNIESTEVSSRYPDRPETAKESSFDLVDFLTRRQIEFKDNRQKGGALWLVGDDELVPVIEELKANGISFTYLRKGGQASGHRGAWYCTTKI
jgi:hypothetical protein